MSRVKGRTRQGKQKKPFFAKETVVKTPGQFKRQKKQRRQARQAKQDQHESNGVVLKPTPYKKGFRSSLTSLLQSPFTPHKSASKPGVEVWETAKEISSVSKKL